MTPLSSFSAKDTTTLTIDSPDVDTTVPPTSMTSSSGAGAQDTDACLYAAMLTATVTKKASALAFKQMGRSMTAPDVLQHLGRSFASVVDDHVENT